MNKQDCELVRESEQLEAALRAGLLEGMDVEHLAWFGLWAAMRVRREVLAGAGEEEARRVLGGLVGVARGMVG